MSFRRLVHPRMSKGLSNFHPFVFNVLKSTETQGPDGFPTVAWSIFEGMEAVQGLIATAGGNEIKQPDQTFVVASHVVALVGHHPGIEEHMLVEDMDGILYDILLVETDAMSQETKLSVRELRGVIIE